MWPKVLPDWVLADIRRKAEIVVYRQLERTLPDSWNVFYSRPWWGVSEKGGELDGEADFIVVHPEHGLLFLEVKGGAVSYDPERDQWSSRDRNGIRHNIKDPMKQALTCKHRFRERLRAIPGWPAGHIRFRHGAVLPDCCTPEANAADVIGPYEGRLFCCMKEFEQALDKWVGERLASHVSLADRRERGPGIAGLEIVKALIANPVALRVPARREIQGEMESMEMLLTGAQLSLISVIDSAPRALVEGGAGTGKTVVAMEMAARYAQAGNSVLFCCRSGPLADHVASRLREFREVAVMKFESLAAVCNWKRGKESQMPAVAPWDIVIIDEAQDFDFEWWDLVDCVIRPGVGRLRVFADSNQAVYRLRDDLETRLGARSFQLRINLRNTKSIARVTERLYKGPLIETPGPDGLPPVFQNDNVEAALNQAVEAMKMLFRHEEVIPSMVALLVPDAEMRQRLHAMFNRMKIPVTDASRKLPGAVVVDTVARFKGLESPVIIVVADRMLAKNQELSYVGVSRARSRLMIFGPVSGTLLEAALKCVSNDAI